MKQDLRALLPRTWYAFMAHHPQPRPVQLEAAPPVLEGLPTLLASSTASGKTEGYAAPLAERYFEELKGGQGQVLVVSPTRALVNDLARRLETPLSRCGIGLQRRTGDHAANLESTGAGFLLTTPESLDSMLSRHPRWVSEARAVVLDELHVMAGTPRGDQVEILLERLDHVVRAVGKSPPQRVAASATVGHPRELADRFLGAGARLAGDREDKEFDFFLHRASSPDEVLERIVAACRQWKCRKVLAFVPSRAEAEQHGQELLGRPPFRSAVLVHHGSLSRQERTRVEKQFLSSPSALCLATPTLELGLDIGDVDLVVMIGPPPDVSAFLQRAGRGSRRAGLGRVLGIARGQADELRLRHLSQNARTGRLLDETVPLHPSVLVQQAFSLLYQNRHRCLTAEALWGRVPASWQERFPVVRLEELLAHLVDRGWLEAGAGERFRPAARLEQAFEHGRIHHNLGGSLDEETVEVVDGDTGRIVGEVRRDRDGRLPDSVTLGGRRRRLVADRGHQALSRSDLQNAGVSRFQGRGTVPISANLAQDFARFLEIPEGDVPWTDYGDRIVVGHFLGTVWSRMLGECLRATAGGAGPWVGWLDHPDSLKKLDHDAISEMIEARPVQLSRRLGAGPWSSELPRSWLREDLLRRVRPELLAARLERLKLVPAGAELSDVLVELLPEHVRQSL
ncbi:MAG: DEAD/DEAH box helicase [Armatimonadetes bacterium]|nr:DEAD/DEAH box helicase [Armatimonadota bacterium]